MIARAASGDQQARNELVNAAYGTLRTIAQRQPHVGRPGHTMQPTALVHEFFASGELGKLLDRFDGGNSLSFYTYVGHAMWSLLRQHWRRSKALKHGGGMKRQPLDGQLAGSDDGQLADLLVLGEAITKLADCSPLWHDVVLSRYIVGRSQSATATELGISLHRVRTIEPLAMGFLRRALRGEIR
jgi:DNA-directed RNA polymerase specialized sigma24 family protein